MTRAKATIKYKAKGYKYIIEYRPNSPWGMRYYWEAQPSQNIWDYLIGSANSKKAAYRQIARALKKWEKGQAKKNVVAEEGVVLHGVPFPKTKPKK